MRTVLRLSFLLALGAAPGASAQTPIPLTITGNEAEGAFTLPGGIGAELKITFESASGLTADSLAATATPVNPADPALLLRLPLLVSVPAAFPVIVRVSPTPSSTLHFTGPMQVTLHTENLELSPSAPQSLLRAPNGGFFSDITDSEASGSYRVCGSGGGFSDFVIVADGRIVDVVIIEKFAALQATLVANAARMPLLVFLTLQSRLAQARTLFEAGSLTGALAKLASFLSYAVAHSGSDIPDEWRADDPSAVNVAGLLRAGGETLRFSITRKLGP